VVNVVMHLQEMKPGLGLDQAVLARVVNRVMHPHEQIRHHRRSRDQADEEADVAGQ
jgi:hypothetical protein